MVNRSSQNNEEKDKRPKKTIKRTKNNNELRESRKNQYAKAKTEYQAATRNEKITRGNNTVQQHLLLTHGTRYTNLPQAKQGTRKRLQPYKDLMAQQQQI